MEDEREDKSGRKRRQIEEKKENGTLSRSNERSKPEQKANC